MYFYTGRTIRAALDALLDNGRPSKVELCILVDRKYSRQLPIHPDYCGKAIDSIITQKVKVYWGDDARVVLYEKIDKMELYQVMINNFGNCFTNSLISLPDATQHKTFARH